jgi:RimJ/RimL family protein N-acetyltransferase
MSVKANEIVIREAQLDDSERLIAYIQRLIAEPDINLPLAPGEFKYTVEEERQVLAKYAAADNSISLIAEVEGCLVGELSCRGGQHQAMRHTAILGMSVAEGWRGQGVGSALMARAIEWARETGIISRIELMVYARNLAAIQLYQKFGFQVEGRRQRAIYQHGEYLDDLMMALLF